MTIDVSKIKPGDIMAIKLHARVYIKPFWETDYSHNILLEPNTPFTVLEAFKWKFDSGVDLYILAENNKWHIRIFKGDLAYLYWIWYDGIEK